MAEDPEQCSISHQETPPTLPHPHPPRRPPPTTPAPPPPPPPGTRTLPAAAVTADPGQPSVTMIRWNDGDVQEQTVVGADTVEAPWPFPTRVNPQTLVED